MAFSKAWDKKQGVKAKKLKERPVYTPQPLRAGDSKQDSTMFGHAERKDK